MQLNRSTVLPAAAGCITLLLLLLLLLLQALRTHASRELGGRLLQQKQRQHEMLRVLHAWQQLLQSCCFFRVQLQQRAFTALRFAAAVSRSILLLAACVRRLQQQQQREALQCLRQRVVFSQKLQQLLRNAAGRELQRRLLQSKR